MALHSASTGLGIPVYRWFNAKFIAHGLSHHYLPALARMCAEMMDNGCMTAPGRILSSIHERSLKLDTFSRLIAGEAMACIVEGKAATAGLSILEDDIYDLSPDGTRRRAMPPQIVLPTADAAVLPLIHISASSPAWRNIYRRWHSHLDIKLVL